MNIKNGNRQQTHLNYYYYRSISKTTKNIVLFFLILLENTQGVNSFLIVDIKHTQRHEHQHHDLKHGLLIITITIIIIKNIKTF